MIGLMPRKKLIHVTREKTRHGKLVWYFREGQGRRIRLPDDFGSPEFMEAYRAALSGESKPTQKADPRSLKWLVGQWKRSSEWAQTKPSTRRQRENVLVRVIEKAGNPPFAAITKEHIRQGREARKDTPAAANNFIKTMRALYRWAEESGHVNANPADGVKNITYQTTGFIPWTRDDLERFRAHWPLGTRQRVALEVYATTGLRRGDAARLGRPHLKDGVFLIHTEKTGTPVYRPLMPDLARAIEAGPVGDLTYICGDDGRPMVKESLGNWFRKACNAAGVKGSAHGVRKLAATIMAEKGATEAELMAAFGWTTSDMPSLYTRSASRQMLAIQAAQRLATGTEDE